MTNVKVITASVTAFLSILGYEGYRARNYLDEGGLLTCGVGDTHNCARAPNDSQDAAAFHFVNYFRNVEATERGMKACLNANVPMPQRTWDAFVSFAFNVGTRNFCRSTAARLLNAGDIPGACAELKRWVYTPSGKSEGLVSRRAQEYAMCMGTP